ncbi:MAG TPA: TIGR04282 family arsenosugar biosynthesis glycosyltransferase [Gammaproteobacteria bacterium]
MSIREPAARSGCCLVVMLKAPERSKRRLAAEIGPRATEAARHLYQCALEDLAEWPHDVCFAPASAADPCPVGADGFVVVQPTGNLGERIEHVDRELRRRGVRRAVFIGTDCIELDGSYLRDAASALDAHDVVLGPARDGGVVLMGARRPWPELGDLPWSTAALGAALRERCLAAGLSVALLAERGDVDTQADLAAARHRLAADPRPARRAFARWLAEQTDLAP